MARQPSTFRLSSGPDTEPDRDIQPQQPSGLGQPEQGLRPVEIMAVVMPALAVANATAAAAVLRSRGFQGFFEMWRVPRGFLVFGVLLGLVCWLVSRQVDGCHKQCAATGAVVCGWVSVAGAVLWLAWLVWLLVNMLFAWITGAIGVVFAAYVRFRSEVVVIRSTMGALLDSVTPGRSSRDRDRR